VAAAKCVAAAAITAAIVGAIMAAATAAAAAALATVGVSMAAGTVVAAPPVLHAAAPLVLRRRRLIGARAHTDGRQELLHAPRPAIEKQHMKWLPRQRSLKRHLRAQGCKFVPSLVQQLETPTHRDVSVLPSQRIMNDLAQLAH